MIFPLIDAIRREHPEAEISCFTCGNNEILRLHPEIDHFYEMPRSISWRRKLGPADHILKIWEWYRSALKDLRFDVCITLRGGVDPFHSAHLAWLLGGRERVGFSSQVEPERSGIDLGADLFLTRKIEKIGAVHEVQRGGEILKLAGLIQNPINVNQTVMSLLSIAHSFAAQKFIEAFPELQGPYGIIAPGASFPRRRWGAERFAILAREIANRGWMPVFVGGAEDNAACEAIAATLRGPFLNLTGKTSFVQLTAVCAGAKCFIGNDSGTAHVAGATGVPTLIITAFAKESLESHHASPCRSHPVGPHSAIAQPRKQMYPCIDECLAEEPHCILQIGADEVRDMFTAFIAKYDASKEKKM